MTSELKTIPEFTEDYLLGGRIKLKQLSDGFRVSIDSILLSAAISPAPNETVLDIGAGVGAASLCLAARCPYTRITGVEVQRELVRYAHDNILLNNLRERVEILHGDLLHPPPRLAAGTYAHVMTNPPYYEADAHRLSPHLSKAISNQESRANFEHWGRFCLLMAKSKGTLTFIHLADRLDEVLAFFYGKLGDIKVYPLWPHEGKPAKRILIQGIKGSNGGLKILPGMILHSKDGKYTPQAEEILRHALAIQW